MFYNYNCKNERPVSFATKHPEQQQKLTILRASSQFEASSNKNQLSLIPLLEKLRQRKQNKNQVNQHISPLQPAFLVSPFKQRHIQTQSQVKTQTQTQFLFLKKIHQKSKNNTNKSDTVLDNNSDVEINLGKLLLEFPQLNQFKYRNSQSRHSTPFTDDHLQRNKKDSLFNNCILKKKVRG